MTLTITPNGQACGAVVTGLDLSQPLTAETIATLRAAWLKHHVLSFPAQMMSDTDLERFSLYFGDFGNDPYFESIEGHPHIAAIERCADEKTPIFASVWHTDWSFQNPPPIATCLYGITIPPHGGDTLFANQHMAHDEMPADLRKRVEGLTAIHSAEVAYAPEGVYANTKENEAGRSMKIIVSEEARAKQEHPFIRNHTETGRPALFGAMGYIQGFVGMEPSQSASLLNELYQYQGSNAFTYRLKWEPDMLVMWDNRSVLHMATGGFDGYDRLLHRTTIAERP